MQLSDSAITEGNDLLAEMFTQLESRANGRDRTREIVLDMRYVGQEHTLTISVPGDGAISADAETIRETFAGDYDRTFGHVIDEEIEIVSLRATIRTELPRRAAEQPAEGDAGAGGMIEAWSFTRGERLPFALVDRAAIGTDGLPGPAIVLEETATTYLDAEFQGRLGSGGILEIHDVKEARDAR